jgi:hypothetical protein
MRFLLRLTHAILDTKTEEIVRILVCRDCGETKWEGVKPLEDN